MTNRSCANRWVVFSAETTVECKLNLLGSDIEFKDGWFGISSPNELAL